MTYTMYPNLYMHHVPNLFGGELVHLNNGDFKGIFNSHLWVSILQSGLGSVAETKEESPLFQDLGPCRRTVLSLWMRVVVGPVGRKVSRDETPSCMVWRLFEAQFRCCCLIREP